MAEDRFFDYEYLQRCNFPIPDKGSSSSVSACREPAVAMCWWRDDMSGKWYLCQGHLDFTRKREDAEIAKPRREPRRERDEREPANA